MLPSLSLQQAYAYLLDAPTIVKQTAPMSWTYLSAPQDGTVFLEWMSRAKGEHAFPSDGYVWCDPEQSFRQEFNGYMVEMMIHQVGFRPNYDHTTSHARTRYHFIAKTPNLNAPPPDPSLWIVHYHQADPGRTMDVRQIPIPHITRSIMNERKWLESQGRLEKKDFMLHDREHWPQISIPGSMAPMPQHMYGQQMTPQQQQTMLQQQRGYPSQTNYPVQQPPAKRPRHSGPSGMGGSIDGGHDNKEIEEEENTSLGDFFDHLSPREISSVRFMQHHRWMEEVFSSPYASSRIVPPDLGIGLMGVLKGLTEGILDPPSVGEITKELLEPASKAKEAQPFTNLKKEQVDEFSKRVERHLEEGHAEVEKMKKEHAEKMAEWKKSKSVLQAEKRLRYATWEGHEGAVQAFRLDVPPANGHAEGSANTETVDIIVEEVEKTMGVKIEGGEEVTMVQKGGLERDETQRRVSDDVGMEHDRMDGFHQEQDAMMSGANNGSSISTLQPYFGQQQPQMKADTYQQQPMHQQAPSAPQQMQHQYVTSASNNLQDDAGLLTGDNGVDEMNDMGDMTMGEDSMMDDMNMDVDVDTGDIDFIEHTPQTGGEEAAPTPFAGEDSATPAQQADTAAIATALPAETPPIATPVTLGETGQQAATSGDVTPQPPIEPSTTEAVASIVTQPDVASAILSADPTFPDASASVVAAAVADASQADTTTDLFDDGTFDDLANMGDGGVGGADDELLDFGGMEDSAFGEAMHGMPTPGGLGEQD